MFESKLNKGEANGYPPLDSNEKIPRKYIYYDFDSSSLATTGSNYFKGNQNVSGSLTASFFVGDGSHLTNVPNTGPIVDSGSSIYTVRPATSFVDTSNGIYFGHDAGFDAIHSDNSVFLGFQAGSQATNANDSFFIGYQAGYQSTNAADSIFIGNTAGGFSSEANNSIFIGNEAGTSAVSSSAAIFIGSEAGNGADEASNSNFIGLQAGLTSRWASGSNFFGFQAGDSSPFSSYANFIGYSAGVSSPYAPYSNFIGYIAGAGNFSSSYSNFFGYQVGRNVYSSSYSTLIGYNVGNNVNSVSGKPGIGDNNIIVGTNLTLPNGTKDSMNIGGVLFGKNLYFDTSSDPFSGSQYSGMIGINKPIPSATLDISGSGFVTGSFSVTHAPQHPNDVIRLVDLPQFTGSGLFYFANNGLTSSIGNVFQLGGNPLIQDTTIDAQTFNFVITGSDGVSSASNITMGGGEILATVSSLTDNGTQTVLDYEAGGLSLLSNSSSGDFTKLQSNPDSIELTAISQSVGSSTFGYTNTSGFTVSDSIFNKGITYTDDFSTVGTLDPNWVPNWGSVLNAFSSSIPGGTANYIPLWNTNGSLTSSIFYQNGNNVQFTGSLEFYDNLSSQKFTQANGKTWINTTRTNVNPSPNNAGIGIYPGGCLQICETFAQGFLGWSLTIPNSQPSGFLLIGNVEIDNTSRFLYGANIPTTDNSTQVANTRFVKSLLTSSFTGTANSIPLWNSNNTLSNSLLTQNGSNINLTGSLNVSGSLTVTQTPVNPNDVFRLQDNKFKGLWTSGQQLNKYDSVYLGSTFGNFTVLQNVSSGSNTISPSLAVQNAYSFNSTNSQNLQSYLSWSIASNNFSPTGDLFYFLETVISSANNSTFPYFTAPRSVFTDNWIEFTITTDNNAAFGFGVGYNSKYRFTPSLVPTDGAWYELLPYYQDNSTYSHNSQPTVKIHVDVCYNNLYFEFRLRTELISGSSGVALPIYTEFHRSECKAQLFSFANPSSYAVIASDYWSILNGNTDPNTIKPNWFGTETGSVKKLGATTQLGDNITDSTGSFFTKTVLGGTSGSLPIWDSNKTLTNSIISQSGSTINISGSLTLQSTSEKIVSISNPSGTVSNDYNNGDIFYYTSIGGDFGVNFINTPLTDSNTIGFTLVLIQGATPHIVNAVQVNGSSQTINWLGGSAPSGNANKIDVVGVSLIRLNSNWTVLGQISTFG